MILLTEGSLLVFLAATKLKSDYELLEAGQKCNTVYNMRKKLRNYKRIFIFSSARTTNSKTIRQHFLIEDGRWMASTNLGLTEVRQVPIRESDKVREREGWAGNENIQICGAGRILQTYDWKRSIWRSSELPPLFEVFWKWKSSN